MSNPDSRGGSIDAPSTAAAVSAEPSTRWPPLSVTAWLPSPNGLDGPDTNGTISVIGRMVDLTY